MEYKVIKLENLGSSETSAKVSEIYHKVGDSIKKGDVIISLTFNKVYLEVESKYTGKIAYIVSENIEVKEGDVLCKLISTDENNKEEEIKEKEDIKIEDKDRSISPIVRKLLRDNSIDSANFNSEFITKRMVLDYLNKRIDKGKIKESKEEELNTNNNFIIKNLSIVRTTIDRKMKESLNKSPQLTSFIQINSDNLIKYYKNNKDDYYKKYNIKLSITSVIIHRLIPSLLRYKVFNSHRMDEYKYKEFNYINIGVATDTSNGLMVPVIKYVDTLSLHGINKELQNIIVSRNNNKLHELNLDSSTFTITNTGSMDILFDTPIINTPEVAILGIGKSTKGIEILENNDIHICYKMYLSLSYDHGVIDGADAGRFLKDLKNNIESIYDI